MQTGQFGTFLHRATWSPWPDLAEALITKGASVEATDGRGERPLHYAAFQGVPQTAQLLIDRGADVNAVDQYGSTPLHYAAKNVEDNRAQIIRLLLKAGADPRARNKFDGTPLHIASANMKSRVAASRGYRARDNRDLVLALLEGGASPFDRNQQGQTCMDVASDAGIRGLMAGFQPSAVAKTPDRPAGTPEQAGASYDLSVLPSLKVPFGTLAVYELTSSALPQGDADTLTEVVRTDITQSGYFRVLSLGDMEKVLETQSFQRSGACDDAQCLVEIGKLLSVQHILGGAVTTYGDTFYLTLRLVDVETGEIVRQEQGSDNASRLPQLARYLVNRLLLFVQKGLPR